VAALNVSFRDVEHVLPIVLQLGYYVTPIFYDIGRIGPEHRWVFALNPMYHIIEAYRAALLHGTMPDLLPILIIAVGSMLLLWLSYGYFERARFRFLEQL
jgi:ABC-type polysaccharide/polyol phosphate export permease